MPRPTRRAAADKLYPPSQEAEAAASPARPGRHGKAAGADEATAPGRHGQRAGANYTSDCPSGPASVINHSIRLDFD